MRTLLFGLILVGVFYGASYCEQYREFRDRISSEYASSAPGQWGENVKGVLTKLNTKDKAIALTFDACGSKGDGFDSELFDFLVKENVPATIFVSGRWIDAHPDEFKRISSDSLFEIENHGANHRPASVNGNSIYGIKGTESPAELIDEVELNARKIEKLTGRKPVFYRSGTAYYDEIAAKIINGLGYEIAGFSVLGDKGATYAKAEVEKALSGAPPGSIVIFHINHPEKETGKGVISAVPALKARGFKFVRLSDFKLR